MSAVPSWLCFLLWIRFSAQHRAPGRSTNHLFVLQSGEQRRGEERRNVAVGSAKSRTRAVSLPVLTSTLTQLEKLFSSHSETMRVSLENSLCLSAPTACVCE